MACGQIADSFLALMLYIPAVSALPIIRIISCYPPSNKTMAGQSLSADSFLHETTEAAPAHVRTKLEHPTRMHAPCALILL